MGGNMNIDYQLTKTHIYLDNQRFLTYGIAAINKSTAEIQRKIPDVSLDKAFVEHVVDLLNSSEAELCHFTEIVYDELNK